MSCEEKNQLSNALYENIELRFRDLHLRYEKLLEDVKKKTDVEEIHKLVDTEKKNIDKKRMDFFLSLKTIQDSFKFTPRSHTWLNKAVVEYKEAFAEKISKENEIIQSDIIESMKVI